MIAVTSSLPAKPELALTAPCWACGRGSANLFAHRFGLQKQQEVIRSPGFRIGARHVEAAEGMCAHHGAGRLAIEIQIADVELAARTVELRAIARIDAAGETEERIVCDRKTVVEVLGLDDREHGAEDLFLCKPRVAIDVDENGRFQ